MMRCKESFQTQLGKEEMSTMVHMCGASGAGILSNSVSAVK